MAKKTPAPKAPKKKGLKAAPKKNKKMDPKLVATKEKHEADFISKRYKIPIRVVREVMKLVGRSRRKIYAELRLRGYEIKTK